MPVHAAWGRLEAHVGPGRPASRGSSGEQGAWACWLWRRGPQHHAAWGGAGAGGERRLLTIDKERVPEARLQRDFHPIASADPAKQSARPTAPGAGWLGKT